MKVYVLSKVYVLGGKEILGVFSKVKKAKKAVENIQSYSWQGTDRLVFMSDYVGARPTYVIEPFEIDPT